MCKSSSWSRWLPSKELLCESFPGWTWPDRWVADPPWVVQSFLLHPQTGNGLVMTKHRHTHMHRQYIGTRVHWQEVKTHPVSFRTFFLFFPLGTFITVSSYSQMTTAVNVNSRKFKIPKWKNKTIPISARITGGNVRDAAQQSIEQKQLDLLFFALSNLLADKPGKIKARACLRGKG